MRIHNNVEKILEVNIKPGYKAGTKIKFVGEGDELITLPKQDIVFIIKEIPHNRFKREGDNLKYNINITVGESLYGFDKEIQFLDSKTFNFQVDVCSPPNGIHVVENLGMPKKDGSKGKLFISYNIIYPNKLNIKQKTLIKEIGI